MISNSVDNFWLLTAMRYGFPALVFIFSAMILIFYKMARYKTPPPIFTGWMIMMVGLFFVGATVHFWAAVFYIFMIALGMGVSLYSNAAIYREAQDEKF
jgi:phosphoglycerol transferase MdoB-like AlkP superfamily enzyme